MKCPNCGFDNPEDTATCGRCGIVLDFSRADLSRFARGEPERSEPAQKSGGAGCGIAACVIVAIVAVGLAVLMIVAAILFPVFFRAREKAVQSSCMSNLKQLELATLMYAQDYGEVMPRGHNWCDATLPCIKNRDVYTCPDVHGAIGTYALSDGVAGRDLKTIGTPAEVVSVFGSRVGWNLHGGPSLLEYRHNGGANIGFVDGHVKWISAGGAPSLTWTAPAPPPSGTTGAGR